jgi:uncharacterized membrane protein YkoI
LSFGKRKIAVITTAVAVLGGIAAGAAVAAGAGGGDDATETPISGAALEQAKAAALAQTGGGRVTGTEVGDEESYYEVEVTLANGDQVDVQLDENFDVVGSEGDGPETGDEGAEG